MMATSGESGEFSSSSDIKTKQIPQFVLQKYHSPDYTIYAHRTTDYSCAPTIVSQ